MWSVRNVGRGACGPGPPPGLCSSHYLGPGPSSPHASVSPSPVRVVFVPMVRRCCEWNPGNTFCVDQSSRMWAVRVSAWDASPVAGMPEGPIERQFSVSSGQVWRGG